MVADGLHEHLLTYATLTVKRCAPLRGAIDFLLFGFTNDKLVRIVLDGHMVRVWRETHHPIGTEIRRVIRHYTGNEYGGGGITIDLLNPDSLMWLDRMVEAIIDDYTAHLRRVYNQQGSETLFIPAS